MNVATSDQQPTVSEMVRQNYRAADVLRKWGINYCCGGNLPLAQACTLKGVDAAAVQAELEAASRHVALPAGIDYRSWPLEFLIDYIELVHHAYLKRMLPALQQQLQSFVAGHIKKYPYLQEVADVFTDLSAELVEHNTKEEESLFPYLRQVNNTYKRRETYGSLFVRTLGKPLDQLVSIDHKRIAALVEELRSVTQHYQFADGACTNHQVIYHKLRELDNDLVQHKHLENNFLYPRVIAMEQELLTTGAV